MNDFSVSPIPASEQTTSAPEGSTAPDDPLERADEPPSHLLIDHHDGLGQRCLKSLAAFEPGDVLAQFGPRRHCDTASRMTVQISEHHHIELGPIYLELINHSCDPNVFFDSQRWELVALRSIAPGDELCFFYPSTEWHMASPFDCVCGSDRCLGRITGAANIAPSMLATHRLSAHIQLMLVAQERAEAREPGLFAGLFARV